MASQNDSYAAAGAPPKTGSGSGDNLLDLVRQLASQGSHLAEQQLALIQAEIREGIGDIKASIGGMIGAAVVGIAGLGVLLMGFAYVLADAIDDLGLATLIVGVVAVILAYVLYTAARKKMDAAHLSPDRTRRTLERTPDIVHGGLHTEPKS